jgi:hypothetical protein
MRQGKDSNKEKRRRRKGASSSSQAMDIWLHSFSSNVQRRPPLTPIAWEGAHQSLISMCGILWVPAEVVVFPLFGRSFDWCLLNQCHQQLYMKKRNQCDDFWAQQFIIPGDCFWSLVQLLYKAWQQQLLKFNTDSWQLLRC